MSRTLAALSCVPCRAGMAAMSPDEVVRRLAELPDWTCLDDGHRIERRLVFPDFAQAFGVVARIAELAETAGHHPDLTFGWGYVTVSLQTHAIGGLHLNDIILAARVDAIVPGVTQAGPAGIPAPAPA